MPEPGGAGLRLRGKQAMRRALLEIARDLLSTGGLGGLSTRRIAQQAGTSTTAIYSLFGGKDGLMEALYLDGFDRLEAALRAVPAAAADSALQRIVALGRQYRAFALQHPQDYAVMFGQGRPGFQPTPAAQLRAWQSLQPLIQSIEQAQRDGHLLEHAPEELAMNLWVASHGVVSLELAGYVPKGLEAQAMHDRLVHELVRSGAADTGH